MKDGHDVVIIGAGPGGSAAAHYLSRHGLDVLLLDRAEFPRDKTCGDGLTPRALGVLRDMGLLDELVRIGHRINGVDLYAPRGHSVSVGIPHQDGWPEFMLVVPRLRLDNLIRERAVTSGARFLGSVHVTHVENQADGVLVSGEKGGQPVSFKGRIAIVATGANLKLLRKMNLVSARPVMMLAARAYYEGVKGLSDRVQARLDRMAVPGYGWVFPTSQTSANIGAGFVPHRRVDIPPRHVFDRFIALPAISLLLEGAKMVGPVKGYPLRLDFYQSPTHSGRVMLVGEAAGLVHPLTGEGIDFALESGQIAAHHLIDAFERGDLSPSRIADYDRALREAFQRLFVLCIRLRDIYLHPLFRDRLISGANRHQDVRDLFTRIIFGCGDPAQGLTLKTFLKVALASPPSTT